MDHFSISETFPTQNLAPATCGHWFSLYVSKQGVLPTSSLTHPALSPSSSSVWNMTWPHQDFCFIFVINWILLLCNSDRQKHKNKEASPVPPMAPYHSLSNRTCSWEQVHSLAAILRWTQDQAHHLGTVSPGRKDHHWEAADCSGCRTSGCL